MTPMQREATQREHRLRAEAANRDAVIAGLRRSLDEVLEHRDRLLVRTRTEADSDAGGDQRRLRQALETVRAAAYGWEPLGSRPRIASWRRTGLSPR
jgi:hypothetical protein